MNRFFHRFAHGAATAMGSHWAFAAAAALCLVWAVTGPAFHYSNTWQLVINTATTVMTFLAVFLIRSEEHTSELSHLGISYAVFCLKKKKKTTKIIYTHT